MTQYQSIPSLAAVVIVAQDSRRIERWQREGSGWKRAEAGPGKTLAIEALGCTLNLDGIHDVAGGPRDPALAPHGSR